LSWLFLITLGQKVYDFTITSMPAGIHEFVWNGTNYEGIKVPSGIYIIQFRPESLEGKKEHYLKTVKLTLLR